MRPVYRWLHAYPSTVPYGRYARVGRTTHHLLGEITSMALPWIVTLVCGASGVGKSERRGFEAVITDFLLPDLVTGFSDVYRRYLYPSLMLADMKGSGWAEAPLRAGRHADSGCADSLGYRT